MFVALAIVFPALLLLAVLGMERVERPLEKSRVRSSVEGFLSPDDRDAQPDFVEQFVADGYRSALKRYWRKNDRRGDDRLGVDHREPPRSGQANATAPLAGSQTEGGTHVAGA